MRYLPYMDHEGLETTTLGLHFHATHDHFPRNVMSLRCTASIGFFYNKTEETALETHRPALSLQSREHFYGKKPLPRVRKPNLHSDHGQDSNPCAWRPLGPQSTNGSTVTRRERESRNAASYGFKTEEAKNKNIEL
ncbi:hypothetical protein E2C01_026861 [Portunus trituberculatus]|uniref:Uncharacterized protein n=1 Tax=Portunus trituberculatus TaxID=210409 RepID=A0A5B7EK44_PORTR|nr:hypothetical protein [Portunus trituberculatus]